MQYKLGMEKSYTIIPDSREKENLGVNMEMGWGANIMIGSISGTMVQNRSGPIGMTNQSDLVLVYHREHNDRSRKSWVRHVKYSWGSKC